MPDNSAHQSDSERLPELFPSHAEELVDLHDRFQEAQVELAYRQELASYYDSPRWHEVHKILDLGCGSGAYMARLAARFPNKHYLGVDHNGDLIARARHRCPASICQFAHQDYRQVHGDFDFLVARLLVQHLPDLEGFLAHATTLVGKHGSLLLIDADDNDRLFWPPAPLLTGFFDAYRATQRDIGRDRDRIRAIAAQPDALPGWHLGSLDHILVPSTIAGNAPLFEEAYALMLDLVDRTRVLSWDTGAVRAEWREWNRRPRHYTQIGLWALRLDRSSSR